MNILGYLCQRLDGLGGLTNEERESVTGFSLLYMYFEARVMNTQANAHTLKRLAVDLADAVPVGAQDVLQCYAYFRDRYWANAGSAQYVHALKMSDAMSLEVLPRLANEPDDHGKLLTCLLIILRYRNNLFHGVKWMYGIEGQKENFDHATRLLLAVIGLDDSARADPSYRRRQR